MSREPIYLSYKSLVLNKRTFYSITVIFFSLSDAIACTLTAAQWLLILFNETQARFFYNSVSDFGSGGEEFDRQSPFDVRGWEFLHLCQAMG